MHAHSLPVSPHVARQDQVATSQNSEGTPCPNSTGETDFDRLPIPYRAVACDLATGEAVVIDHGSLATAMRASMSIPAAFPPVELDGRKLIDGGSAANFPVGIAHKLGAEHVIGVDISSILDDKGLESVFGVYGQLSSILIANNRNEDIRRMRPSDVLIVPELGGLSFVDFKRAEEAVDIGEAAARAKVDELRQFSVPEEEYAAFQARHRRQTEEMPVLDEVKLVEWQNVFQTGNTMLVGSEFYQPLDLDMAWFVAPYAETREVTLPLWLDGDDVAEYRMERILARVDVGRVLGNWGELRLGVAASANDGEARIGDSYWPDVEADLCGVEASFKVDTLDSVVFPTGGVRLDARYAYGLEELGTDEEYERAFLRFDGALTWRKLAFLPGLELASNFHDGTTIFNAFALGGFARLSGLAEDELIDERTVLARVLVYQELAGIKIVGAKVRVVGGVSLEAGNALDQDDSVTWEALRYAGSVFVGADTAQARSASPGASPKGAAAG